MPTRRLPLTFQATPLVFGAIALPSFGVYLLWTQTGWLWTAGGSALIGGGIALLVSGLMLRSGKYAIVLRDDGIDVASLALFPRVVSLAAARIYRVETPPPLMGQRSVYIQDQAGFTYSYNLTLLSETDLDALAAHARSLLGPDS